MPKSYTLAIYALTINYRGNSKDNVVLSDFNHGTDFLDSIYALLKTWCYDSKDSANAHFENEKADSKAFRIGKDKDGNDILYKTGRFISGIIESGSYGTEEPLIDINTGLSTKRKYKNEALLRPFFFEFYIPKDSGFGFLIVERISSFGIYSILYKRLESFFTQKDLNLVFKLSPLTLYEVAERNKKALNYLAKKIVVHQLSEDNLKISRITGNAVDDSQVRTRDIVYKAFFNKYIDVSKLLGLKKKKNSNFYEIDNDIKFTGIDVEIKIGDKTRMMSVEDIRKGLGTSMDVTDKVQINTNGYPTFESLQCEAMLLVSYINRQFNWDEP